MNCPQPILRLALASPAREWFDYLPPEGVDPESLQPGVRLRVPFRNKELCGVLLERVEQSDVPAEKLRPALAVLDPVPLFSADDLELLRWAAGYYHHPLGEVVTAALPGRLRDGRPPLERRPLRNWRLAAAGRAANPGRAVRQAAVLELLGEHPEGLDAETIRAICEVEHAVLDRLAEKGWIEPAPPGARPGGEGGRELMPEQAAALRRIAARLDRFGVFLLDGVTGSGKTEVYIRLAQQAIEAGGQALVLVPEIGLTPQLLRRFERRLAAPIAVLHSGLADGERELAWQRARRGEARLVIGTRSAIFTPLPDLALILVDEEHDLSFKQQEGLRYSARDLALVRAQRRGCPVVLGSATPALESLHNAATGRYERLALTQRAGTARPPAIETVDIRSARLDGGLSATLMRRIGENLAAGNQTLVFLNRRGYAPILTCHACGMVMSCTRCDARLTLHLGDNRLWCHHCGAVRRVPEHCPDCNAQPLMALGRGTERVEETLARQFPEAGIARIDRDSTRRKGSLEQVLDEVRQGKYPLLVGTQMLAKGHHFPAVTLVCILDLDGGLFGADYRAAERTGQLLVQVAGRAGRAERPGTVLIQTRHPDHPLLNTLLREGYAPFAAQLVKERREAQLPPFSVQALVRAESEERERSQAFLTEAAGLADGLAARFGVERFGPVPAPMERREGRYRMQVLFQSARRGAMQGFLDAWLPQVRGLPSGRAVRWSLDVDPLEMF